MLKRHPHFAIVSAFVAGILVSHTLTGYSQQPSPVENDTSERVVKALTEELEGTTWNTGPGLTIRFLSDMKTTNHLNRTGNWVVTDEKTIITGGRAPVGSLYVWKLDKNHRRAEITRFNLDKSYRNSAVKR